MGIQKDGKVATSGDKTSGSQVFGPGTDYDPILVTRW
jgi:hypothetical protein